MESINKPPKSAMAFYIKMYRQKQRMKNGNTSLIEATKSWVAMSKADKQYIINTFEEYNIQKKKMFASNLRKAQLYMKKKQACPERLCKSEPIAITSNEPYDDTEMNKEGYDTEKDEHEINMEQNNAQPENDDANLQNVTCVSTEADVSKLISEPTPPLRTAMELFEVIKHNDQSTCDVNWRDLTRLQKRRYQRALQVIKNDYIKRYTEYLKQMPSEQLFHYYKSNSNI